MKFFIVTTFALLITCIIQSSIILKLKNEVKSYSNLQNEINSYDQFKKIKEIIGTVNSRLGNERMCLKRSIEIIKELERNGIQAELKVGESDITDEIESEYHAWISIWFDSKTFLPTSNYYELDKARERAKRQIDEEGLDFNFNP